MKNIFKLLFLVFFVSCNRVDFDAAHPSDQKSLDKFEADFVGNYYCADSSIGKKDEEIFLNSRYYLSSVDKYDSITLFSVDFVITEKLARYTLDFTCFFRLEKVDTSRLNKRFGYKDVFIRDKYFIHTKRVTDTLLDLSRKDKLFLYNNRYYLNHSKIENEKAGKTNSWEICQFEKSSPELFSLNVTNEKDYKLLFDTLQTWQEILPIAHLSNKQFKNFVDKGGFHEKYRLIKSKK